MCSLKSQPELFGGELRCHARKPFCATHKHGRCGIMLARYRNSLRGGLGNGDGNELRSVRQLGNRRFALQASLPLVSLNDLKSDTVPFRAWMRFCAVVDHNGNAASEDANDTIASTLTTPPHPTCCCSNPSG